ncbi:hypothetical protein ['Paenibacillus yunnanensis' Narsing Rao et al. 2020]|uniref:hypothetical protein n=1 Tax=Paenibacillus tengchongensis TaxID=2608684 RepID=UPI001651FBEE|nr:hypothetical protein [Paenibacillus tengchongensis]
MNRYEGIGVSALKYGVLNFVLIFNHLLLFVMGPDGGGTGDREEGLGFYTVHWVVLICIFAGYGLYAITSGRAQKRIRALTALPLLVASVGITGLLIYSLSQNKDIYDTGGFFNELGAQVLQLNVDALMVLIYGLIGFAVLISTIGVVARRRFSIPALLLNVLLLAVFIKID